MMMMRLLSSGRMAGSLWATTSPQMMNSLLSWPTNSPSEFTYPAHTWERDVAAIAWRERSERSEEHTSELQSLRHLVCRLLLEKKKTNTNRSPFPFACAVVRVLCLCMDRG